VLADRAAAMHSVLALLTGDQQAAMTAIAHQALAQLGVEPEAEGRLCRLCDLEACGRSQGRCPVAPRRTRRTVVSRH
jgi:hypothetical protein